MKKIYFGRLLYCVLSVGAVTTFLPTIIEASESFHLQDIFQNQRERFSGFLDNVLRQKSSSDFYARADKIIAAAQPTNDAEYYNALLKHRNELIPQFSTYYTLKLLNFQKDLLSKQAIQLIGTDKTYSRCVEIGTPGTYLSAISSLNSSIKEISVINETQQATDALQAFAFRPFNGFLAYDHFYPLTNYEPISEEIASNSIDLVVCFIGLHHIPAEKIETFVASIARIIKPGGVFLLRDHDCYDAKIESIIYGAHSIYNIVIPGESEESERNEIRNFQPLDYWITLLESFGLEASRDRILQDGDSSLNTMIKCTKIARTAEEHIAQATEGLSAQPDYQREMIQSYLNAPEWYNVEISQEYGDFINHTPFYAFPYFKSIATFWKIYYCSIAAAAKKRGLFSALTASHNLMNMFIGTSMSLEYVAKGIISLPIRLMYSGVEPTVLPLLIYDKQNRIIDLDKRIEISVGSENKAVKLIQVPRYKPLVETLRKIAFADIEIIEMSGNKEIACKVRYSSSIPTPDFDTINGCSLEYTWQLPTQAAETYAILTVAFSNLKEIFAHCDAGNIEILYFHDY